jgi:arabinan endo-1,5-alpha-L-arabinosidase
MSVSLLRGASLNKKMVINLLLQISCMKKYSFLIIIIFLLNVSFSVYSIDLTGDIFSHDPSGIIKEGNTYWDFHTGDGILSVHSDNLIDWTNGLPVFTDHFWPSWINTAVPGFTGTFWAPDIIYMNNAYYLYYSCSTFGSSKSAIGVARADDLNEAYWDDLGMVVSSNGSSTAINAIDPGIFKDTDGKIFMTYGSWFGGIGIVEIDSVTGLAKTSATYLYGGNHQSIEASYLIKKGINYYLIVNRGNCCQGVNSTYYITIGRSTNIFGPYTDWRNLLTTSGKYIGPGHFGLLHEGCTNYVSIHYYDKNSGGISKLDILKMNFVDGWPVLTRDFTIGDCSIEDIKENSISGNQNSIKLFPNPSKSSFISVELSDLAMNEVLTVEIFNMVGKLVYRNDYLDSQPIQIDSWLEKGIYIVQLKSKTKSYSQKLVIY